MKRLIFILAVVCTVFIGCGSVGYAFGVGEDIEGVTVTEIDLDFEPNYWFVCYDWYNFKTLYVSEKPFTYTSSGYYVTPPYLPITFSTFNGSIVGVSAINPAYVGSKPVSSNHDICDSSGNVVFQRPPVLTPTPGPVEVPEGIASVRIIPQAITANLTLLIPLGLVVLAILLGVRLLLRLVVLFLR